MGGMVGALATICNHGRKSKEISELPTHCISLGPSKRRCVHEINKDFIRENASTRENKKEAEEDWKSHHVMIKSDPK